MKIAYLISAYTDPNQLKRLIVSLYVKDETFFFIHIDRKVDIFPFQTKLDELNISKDAIKLLKNRIYTTWGGYSQCKYQKALLDSCIAANINFDRVFFLSGTDYPIWSNQKIFQFLEKNKNKEFINGRELIKSSNKRQINKVKKYHFFRDIKCNNNLRRYITAFSRRVFEVLPINKKTYINLNEGLFKIYFGSMYICITFELAKYISQKMEDKKLIKYFKTSLIPDELMIPSIVFNSKYKINAKEINNPEATFEDLTPIHLVDYGKQIKVFTDEDFEKIIESGKMFLRKTLSGKSDKLIEMIEEKRSNEK